MSAARLAARCLALLGPPGGPVALRAPAAGSLANALAARLAVAADGVPPAAAVLVLLGAPVDVAGRTAMLRQLHATLPPGAPLVAVDHSLPRTLARRAWAAARLLLAGQRPARARHPTARELLAAGFPVVRLELAAGERVQLILARRR